MRMTLPAGTPEDQKIWRQVIEASGFCADTKQAYFGLPTTLCAQLTNEYFRDWIERRLSEHVITVCGLPWKVLVYVPERDTP